MIYMELVKYFLMLLILIKEGKNLHLILPYEGLLDNLSSKGVKFHYNLGVQERNIIIFWEYLIES